MRTSYERNQPRVTIKRTMQTPPVQRDLALLLPSFRVKIDLLVANMITRGFKPKVWETMRTPQRASYLASIGKSKNGPLSMHCLGAAADFVDAEKLWDNPAFFKALGEEATKLHLTWGGDWDGNPATREDFVDSPHVQAIPVAAQNRFRALRSVEARELFIQRIHP